MLTKGVDSLNFGLGSLGSSTPYDRLAMGYSGRQIIAPELPGGVFAPTGLCFIKRQSLQPSEEIQALMKAPLSKRLVCLLFLKETSVLLLRILAG
jgi:hypothetical protein